MRYVALLRGIGPSNPNMRKEKLRALFHDLGFQNVQTVTTTGNVLFETPAKAVKALEATIEEAIQYRLGFTSATIIRSRQQLRRLVASNPFEGFEDSPKSRLNVTFLKEEPKSELRLPYDAKGKGYAIVGVVGRDLCTVVHLGAATTSDLMAWLEKQFGKAITTRTWKTVGKILSRLDSTGR